MGIACLEVSQACSSNIVPMVGSRPPFATPQSGRPGRIDSDFPEQSNPDETASPCPTGNEWVVVQQAIAGNARAQEQLFARPARKLYRAVFAVLQNKEDAEDALQDGLCKAFTSLRSFQGRSSFSTWLTRIVINSALMARRRKSAHPEASLDEMLDYQPKQIPRGIFDPRPDPEKLYAETELNARVEEHVSQLPPALQMAIRLHALYGLSAPHSGKVLGISASAIKSRIFRARLKLACRLHRSLEVSAITLMMRKRGCLKVKG
jgi:RNA polymerase sigma-70 factor (ECF subfamily)